MDKDEYLSAPDDLLLSTHGNIDSYLGNPIRKGPPSEKFYHFENYIETAAFWIDELKP